jgi:Na+/H+ antiporter NhaB
MAIPNIFNILLIAALFFLIFMIIGVNFFKGLLYYCNTDMLPNADSITIPDKWSCINFGAEWQNSDYSFDNIFSA